MDIYRSVLIDEFSSCIGGCGGLCCDFDRMEREKDGMSNGQGGCAKNRLRLVSLLVVQCIF